MHGNGNESGGNALRSLLMPVMPSAGAYRRFSLGLLLLLVMFLSATQGLDAKIKQKIAPRPEPDLKIIDLKVSPLPYVPGRGPLEFMVIVQLPKEADDGLMLEVTSLLTSTSMTSLRFLTDRQPLNSHAPAVVIAGTDSTGEPLPRRVRIRLAWDGLDHNKHLTPQGTYEYEVRAKLLSNGEKGQKTLMRSWPKRGTFPVK